MQDNDKFGNTNGTFNDKQLFACPKNKGIFLSIDKLEIKLSSLLLKEYSKQSALGVAPSRTLKITFVGPEGSSKTSSIKTLLGKKFDKHEQSTSGAILGIQTIIKWFKGGNENTKGEASFELQSSHAIGWRETSASDKQKVLEKECIKEMSSKLISLGDLQSVRPAESSVVAVENDFDIIDVDAEERSDSNISDHEPSNADQYQDYIKHCKSN